MGCDIHIFIERATPYPDCELLWFGFGDNIRADRDYEMFGAIAGVRNSDIEPIGEPRGWPEDTWRADDFDVHDYHSWTTIYPDELQEAIKRAKAYDDYDRSDYEIILRFCRDIEKAGDKVRLVIGFDS